MVRGVVKDSNTLIGRWKVSGDTTALLILIIRKI